MERQNVGFIHGISSQRRRVPLGMLLFISSLQLYCWDQLTFAKDQNLFFIEIDWDGMKKPKN